MKYKIDNTQDRNDPAYDHKILSMGSKSFYRGEEEYCQNNPCRGDVLFVEVRVSRARDKRIAG